MEKNKALRQSSFFMSYRQPLTGRFMASDSIVLFSRRLACEIGDEDSQDR